MKKYAEEGDLNTLQFRWKVRPAPTVEHSKPPPAGPGFAPRFVLPDRLVGPSTQSPTANFMTMVEWEGVVREIDADEGVFSADLQDVSGDAVPTEYAEFFIEDVRDDDLSLLQEGAVFRWVIGKRENVFGTVERTSRIVFRRMPAYSKADLDRADARARALVDAIPIE